MSIPSYNEPKNLILSYFWRACVDKSNGWSYEQVCAWLVDELEGVFDEKIEQLASETTLYGLCIGWSPKQGDYHRARCIEIMSGMKLEEELSKLAEDDAADFRDALDIVGLMRT